MKLHTMNFPAVLLPSVAQLPNVLKNLSRSKSGNAIALSGCAYFYDILLRYNNIVYL